MTTPPTNDLASQMEAAYERHFAGARALDAILAKRTCDRCGQTRATCQRAIDSMFICQVLGVPATRNYDG